MNGGLRAGLQLYTLNDDMAKDFQGTLYDVAEMGYEGVEFAGLFGHSAQAVRDMVRAANLIPVSAHVPLDELLGDPAGTVEKYRFIGCRYIAIPGLEESRRPGKPGFEKTIEQIREIAAEVRRQGLTPLYHNHDFEFVKLDGEYALDRLYREVPELETQLDTCWVRVGGADPAAYVRKYTGRAPLVHLKDYWESGERPARLYDLIGVDDEKAEDTDAFSFRSVGHGVQDFKEILRACQDAGTAWVIVEQDRPTKGKMPKECAAMSMDFLKNVVW